MDQHPQHPSSDKDLGITIVFLIVLVAALLEMRYDNSRWLSNLLQGNTQVERPVTDAVPIPRS